MATLNPSMAARLQSRHRSRQGGYVLLLSLITLLVIFLGFLYVLHGTFSDAQMTGNAVQRSKDMQASDLALRTLDHQIAQAASGGQALELAATSQPWWRAVPPGTAAPTAAYWGSCVGASNPANQCEQVTPPGGGSLPGNYQALAVVQPTGRTDSYSCQIAQYTAVYYDIFIHTAEPNGKTAADTETVYKLCVPTGS